jgi:hypothetical protein
MQEATVHLSAHAVRHGLAAALPAAVGILVSGRGERSRDDDFDGLTCRPEGRRGSASRDGRRRLRWS